MRIHGLLASAMLVLLAFETPPALAQLNTSRPAAEASVLQSISRDQLTALMAEEGYSTSIDKDGDIVWKIEGFKSYLFILDDGAALQFHSSFINDGATLKKINEWNQSKRYSRSYLDDDGDPTLELDLDLAGGITRERIKDYLKTCRASFNAWYAEVVD